MSAGINTYKTDLREIFFTLFEQFGFGQVSGQAPFEAWGPDEAKAVLTETYRFAREVLGPLNSVGDREGCRVENGAVHTPPGFKDAWKKLYEQGFKTVAVDPQHGGQGGPMMLQVTVEEVSTATVCNFLAMMYLEPSWEEPGNNTDMVATPTA